MKKVVCGIIIGTVVSTGIQVSAIGKRWSYQSYDVNALNELGEVLFEVMNTQKSILSKLRSIDKRLQIENEKEM